MRVAIISPTAPPAPGGASQWLDSLCAQLGVNDSVEGLVAISEYHPEAQSWCPSRTVVRRRLPYRAGRTQKTPGSYLSYIAQQAVLVAELHALRHEADVVLLHSSYFYHPSVLPALLASRDRSFRVVVDIRDTYITPRSAARMRSADAHVVCSAATKRAAVASGISEFAQIPVPFSPPTAEPTTAERLLDTLSLADRRYVFFPNGVSHVKGIDAAVELVAALRRFDLVDHLVVAGRERDHSAKLDAAVEDGWARYIGAIDHPSVIALISQAALVPVLSASEGLSRIALEALALRRPVIVPHSVDEFARHDPDMVCDPGIDASVFHAALRVLRPDWKPTYPLSRHQPDTVAQQYIDLFSELLGAA